MTGKSAPTRLTHEFKDLRERNRFLEVLLASTTRFRQGIQRRWVLKNSIKD
jgi:hypothetical protein